MADEDDQTPANPEGHTTLNSGKHDDLVQAGSRDGSSWFQVIRDLFPGGYCKELKDTMIIGWALMITNMGHGYFSPIATIFAGHLGKAELDAIGLSNTLISVSGNCIIFGYSTALDTVFSQTYGGGNYEMVGIYFQRGLILTLLCLLPCYALHLNIEPILVALGQDRHVSRLVGQYLLYFMPGMFCLFFWTTIRKFTVCQNAVYPHILIIIIGHAVHAILQYLFLYQFHLGIVGSACAQAMGFFMLLVVTIIYTVKSAAFRLSWGGLDKRCLYGWGELGLLGLQGILMYCLEWWILEGAVFLAGSMGNTELAAQSVSFNLELLSSRPLDGFAIATSIRVGQLLGEMEDQRAKTAARVGLSIALVNAILWFTVFLAGRIEIPKIFTNDRDILDMVYGIMPLMAVFFLADSFKMVGRGVFRGVGKHYIGMVIVLIAFYILGAPVAVSLALLTTLGIKGLWLGINLATYVIALVYFVFINYKFDWEKLAQEAHMRSLGNASGHGPRDDHTNKDDEERYLVSSDGADARKVTKGLVLKRILILVAFSSISLSGLLARLLTATSYRDLDPDQKANNSTLGYSSLYNMTVG